MAFERIEVAELAGQCAQHGGSRRGAFKLLTGLMDREPGGGGKDQHPQQVTALNGTGHGQGQGVERVDGERVHVLALQGILRIRRHRDSPIAIEGIGFSLSLSESPLFFIALFDHDTIFNYLAWIFHKP